MTIYILKGATGEYSDYEEWAVKGFTDKAAAEDYAITLNNKLIELGVHTDYELCTDEVKLGMKFKWNAKDVSLRDKEILELDKLFRIDYTGTKYWIEELELIN